MIHDFDKQLDFLFIQLKKSSFNTELFNWTLLW